MGNAEIRIEVETDPFWLALNRRLGVDLDPGGSIGKWGRPDARKSIRDDVWLMIEVERGQSHPEGNVLKYWPWLVENAGVSIAFAHVFERGARQSKGSRGRLARWVGEAIEANLGDRFRYFRIDLESPDEASQLEALRAWVRGLGASPEEGTQLVSPDRRIG